MDLSCKLGHIAPGKSELVRLVVPFAFPERTLDPDPSAPFVMAMFRDDSGEWWTQRWLRSGNLGPPVPERPYPA